MVSLTLLSLVGIMYVGRHVGYIGGSLEDVRGKAVITSSVTITLNSSSLEQSMSIGQAPYTQLETGNTNHVMNPNSKTTIIHENTPGCCLRPSVDLEQKLTPKFFASQRNRDMANKDEWTGNEYEEWVAIKARLNRHNKNQTDLNCPAQYTLLALDHCVGNNLRTILTDLGKNGKLTWLPYYQEKPGLPRILLLGDSIARGIRSSTQQLYNGQANIQGAPTNCAGFAKYRMGLKDWLGYCPWDLVQFNVGMHFHPELLDNSTSWPEQYRKEITNIVNQIRAHSPSTHIVFALTTPSPFDSAATTPKRATCPHYDKFHKAGFATSLNDVARSLSQELGIIINDRYSAILPVLEQYQMECNIHYYGEGYEFLARQDWKFLSAALSLNTDE